MKKYLIGGMAGFVAGIGSSYLNQPPNTPTKTTTEPSIENLIEASMIRPLEKNGEFRFYSEDDVWYFGSKDASAFTIFKLEPVRTLEVVDFNRVCIADVGVNHVTYGFELWDKAHKDLLSFFERDLADDRLATGSEPIVNYVMGTYGARVGQFVMTDKTYAMYERKIDLNPTGFDFTVTLKPEGIYWYQGVISDISDQPLAPCDSNVDTSILPAYEPLIQRYWGNK